jgi:hypothetical protein
VVKPARLQGVRRTPHALFAVSFARNRVGHLAFLAQHHEGHLERKGDRRAQHKAAGVDADDARDALMPVPWAKTTTGEI